MARNEKWIDAECHSEAVSAVARRVIDRRLRNVCRWLPRAASDGLYDAESVHQLRVSTRRAMVALDLFESLLPAKRRNWMRKRLKRIRRVAGPARDLDVMAERLSNEETQAVQAPVAEGLAELLEQISEQRSEAQGDIIRLRRKLKKAKFSKRTRRLATKARWRDEESAEPTFRESAGAAMREVAGEFFDRAMSDLDSTQALHEVRLAAKKLRYAMEVFGQALGPRVREELYPLVAQLQEQLGRVNDHATARERYSQWLEEADSELQRAALEQLIERETAAMTEAAEAFRVWWSPQRAAEERARFLGELGSSEARCA